jgi:hypothetical protein
MCTWHDTPSGFAPVFSLSGVLLQDGLLVQEPGRARVFRGVWGRFARRTPGGAAVGVLMLAP